MNKKISNKAWLAFDDLEKEMELMGKEDQEKTKGGTVYKYVTDSITNEVIRYHSNNNGMSWFRDYDYYGVYDSFGELNDNDDVTNGPGLTIEQKIALILKTPVGQEVNLSFLGIKHIGTAIDGLTRIDGGVEIDFTLMGNLISGVPDHSKITITKVIHNGRDYYHVEGPGTVLLGKNKVPLDLYIDDNKIYTSLGAKTFYNITYGSTGSEMMQDWSEEDLMNEEVTTGYYDEYGIYRAGSFDAEMDGMYDDNFNTHKPTYANYAWYAASGYMDGYGVYHDPSEVYRYSADALPDFDAYTSTGFYDENGRFHIGSLDDPAREGEYDSAYDINSTGNE